MMHRFPPRAGLAALALAALAACDDPGTAPRADADQELARQVEALGFRGDMVRDFGDYVVVEGDIRLTRDQLRAGPPRSGDPLRPSYQYRTTALVGSPKVHQITVNLAGLAAEPDWQNAARAALPLWNGIPGSYVRIVEAAPGAPADITFVLGCLSSNSAAEASWPANGNPGPTITVNRIGCIGFAQNNQQRLHNMVHEIGHTLGFRHTNWFARSEQNDPLHSQIGAVHIPGTPGTGGDPGSVMNGGTALNSWAGFSSADQYAARSLYPLPAPTGLASSHPSGTVVLSWSPVVGATSYSIQRVEVYYVNDYEFGSSETVFLGAGGTAYGTTYDTGSAWTGVSYCSWYSGTYRYEESRYWYEVKAVFPNGTSITGASVDAEDATC